MVLKLLFPRTAASILRKSLRNVNCHCHHHRLTSSAALGSDPEFGVLEALQPQYRLKLENELLYKLESCVERGLGEEILVKEPPS